MERALYEYIIVGVKTNIIFHKAVLRNARFRSGDINTGFIKEENMAEAVKQVAAVDYEKGKSLASALGADNARSLQSLRPLDRTSASRSQGRRAEIGRT